MGRLKIEAPGFEVAFQGGSRKMVKKIGKLEK